MIPATQMPSSGYSTKLPTPEHFQSKLSSVCSTSCLQKSAFSFGTSLCVQFCFLHLAQPYLVKASKRMSWSLRSSADGSGLNPSSTDNRSGTRLMRAIQAFQTKLNVRFNELRKDLPLKLLFLLLGFYCSTAFATVIGQTGDWDILSAAMAVAVVEGIGALMYTDSLSLFVKYLLWIGGLSESRLRVHFILSCGWLMQSAKSSYDTNMLPGVVIFCHYRDPVSEVLLHLTVPSMYG